MALVLVVQGSGAALAQDAAKEFSAGETEAFQKMVREYLLQNPEIIVEALQTYEQRQQLAETERQREALIAERSNLNEDPLSPVLGNPEGDVTVVEFFDYRCPYCRRAAEVLQELVAEDPNVRLVMKEYPILSQESVEAARAALAAAKQDKYESFHFTLMETGGSMSEAEVMAVAQATGLDVERLQRDMQLPEIEEALRRNYALAETVGITGTPAMVIGTALVPGVVSLERLKELVAEARAQAS
ncbi:DsbA family protein [Pelagibius litoralis]|uniref:DsbA family protein n=2 Tax=Pelagibius litoralis TaxID=374515 RepID=A0A967CC22_9PROT|nr:DsbA family protein [Pelagibius litoralis]